MFSALHFYNTVRAVVMWRAVLGDPVILISQVIKQDIQMSLRGQRCRALWVLKRFASIWNAPKKAGLGSGCLVKFQHPINLTRQDSIFFFFLLNEGVSTYRLVSIWKARSNNFVDNEVKKFPMGRTTKRWTFSDRRNTRPKQLAMATMAYQMCS